MDHALGASQPRNPDAPAYRRLIFLGAWVILLMVVASKFMGTAASRERDVTIQRVHEIQTAMTRYSVDNSGAVPTTSQGLKALRTKPDREPIPRNWHGPYLPSDEMLKDGWGRLLQYVAPGGLEPDTPGVDPITRAYDLWSLGADGREGGVGVNASIRSWEAQTAAP